MAKDNKEFEPVIEEVEELEELEIEDDGDFSIVDEDESIEDVEILNEDLGPQTIDILPEIDEESIEDLDDIQDKELEKAKEAKLILEPMDEEEEEPLSSDNFKKDEVQVKPIDFNALKKEIKEEIHEENNKKLAKALLILTPLLAILGIATSWAFTAISIYLGYVYKELEDDAVLLYYTIGVMTAIVILRLTSVAYAVGRIVGS